MKRQYSQAIGMAQAGDAQQHAARVDVLLEAGGRRQRPVRSRALRKARRKAVAMEPRMPHIVLAAPTSMAPTAMGRTMLYQTEKITSAVSGAAPPAACAAGWPGRG